MVGLSREAAGRMWQNRRMHYGIDGILEWNVMDGKQVSGHVSGWAQHDL